MFVLIQTVCQPVWPFLGLFQSVTAKLVGKHCNTKNFRMRLKDRVIRSFDLLQGSEWGRSYLLAIGLELLIITTCSSKQGKKRQEI